MEELEAFYGGAAGPGKSWGGLMGGLQFADVPGYAGLIVRQSYSDLSLPGALLEVAHEWLDGTDAKYDPSAHVFKFPGGGKLAFGYCKNVKEVQRYRGAQFQYIALDESSLFPERVYRFLFSRLRRPAVPCVLCGKQLERRGQRWVHAPVDVPGEIDSEPQPLVTDCPAEPNDATVKAYGAAPDGTTIFDVPLRMRAMSNPGGVGHAWNKARFVDTETRKPGVRFLKARMEDNPDLDKAAYRRSLRELDPVNFLRFEAGDWEAREPGQWFFKEQFPVVGQPWPLPNRDIARVRRWDLASSEVNESGDPDWTAGVLMARNLRTGKLQIQDIVRVRSGPSGVEKAMQDTAEKDGVAVPIVIEQEPGSSGKSLISAYRRGILAGYNVKGLPSSGPKEARIRVLVPLADEGSIEIVRGAWNQAWTDEAEAWRPDGEEHDDQLDAAAAANADLSGKGRARIIR